MRRGKTLEFDEDDDDDEVEKEKRKGEVTLEEIENQRNLESGLEEQTVDRLGPGSTSTEMAMDQFSGKQSSTQEEVISVPGVGSNKNPQSETGPVSLQVDGLSILKLVKKRVQLVGKNGLNALKLVSWSGGMANNQSGGVTTVLRRRLMVLGNERRNIIERVFVFELMKTPSQTRNSRKGGEKMRSLLDERCNHVDQVSGGPKEPIQAIATNSNTSITFEVPDRHLLQNLEITLDDQKLKLMEIEIERVCKTFNSFPKKLQKALKLKNSKRLRKSLKMTGHNRQLEDKMVKAIGLSNWRAIDSLGTVSYTTQREYGFMANGGRRWSTSTAGSCVLYTASHKEGWSVPVETWYGSVRTPHLEDGGDEGETVPAVQQQKTELASVTCLMGFGSLEDKNNALYRPFEK
ncbi:hypothetical protein PPACK8108_LOCUS686 [Phakopsora pachyrhizi]|uniref:Uncharacterized protein n=1 Tax=Phakopsora pachyrhizi TaxID=170000 RepID=A0AAV0AGB5_PHAPC|nr:hypothetical protein PPACK8108_LOCUS686 [Phakopsora pachyrhizi]